MAPGVTREELEKKTDAPLYYAETIEEMLV